MPRFKEVLVDGQTRLRVPSFPDQRLAAARAATAGRLRQLFGNPQSIGTALHLRIHVGGIDVGAAPEHDEMIEEVCAFTHDTRAAALHSLKRDLTGLLNDLLCRAAAS